MSLGVFQVTAPLPECHQAAKVATTKSVTIATQSDRHREGGNQICMFFFINNLIIMTKYTIQNPMKKVFQKKSSEK